MQNQDLLKTFTLNSTGTNIHTCRSNEHARHTMETMMRLCCVVLRRSHPPGHRLNGAEPTSPSTSSLCCSSSSRVLFCSNRLFHCVRANVRVRRRLEKMRSRDSKEASPSRARSFEVKTIGAFTALPSCSSGHRRRGTGCGSHPRGARGDRE